MVRSASSDDGSRQDDLVRYQPMLEIASGDHHEHPAEDDRDEGLEREAVDETARAGEQCRAGRHQRQPRRSRHAPKQRVVERSVGCEAVCNRAGEQPGEQPDEAGSDVHETGFPDGGRLPPEFPVSRAFVPSPGG